VSRSSLRHVRRDLTGKKVLADRSEEIDHFRILWEKGFVLDPTGYYGDITRLNRSLLSTDTKSYCALNHPNKLLLRMLVTSNMRARLHSPIDHRALLAGYDATADLVRDLFLGH
jgi:hypothetical protein